MKSKYTQLLEDADINRWFENLKARSIVTATVYLRTLGLYCELNQTTPKALLKIAQTKTFRDSFMDFVRQLEKEGKAGSYITRFKKVLHSWFLFNGLDVKLKVNIAGERDTPTIINERIPNKEELDRIIRMGTPRARVSIVLMAFSGLRPESLGNYEGTDGIRLGDFLEAKITEKGIEFPKIPTPLVIRKGLSKVKHQYFTFVPEQAITYIKEYLEKRAQE